VKDYNVVVRELEDHEEDRYDEDCDVGDRDEEDCNMVSIFKFIFQYE